MHDKYEPIAAQKRAASLYEQARYCHEAGRWCLAGMLQRMAARQSAMARALTAVPPAQREGLILTTTEAWQFYQSIKSNPNGCRELIGGKILEFEPTGRVSVIVDKGYALVYGEVYKTVEHFRHFYKI